MKHQNLSQRALQHLVLAVAALACSVPLSTVQAGPMDWIAGEKVQGNGNIKKQKRDLAHFTGVALSLPGKVELRIGNTESVTIETDDNLLPLIETVIDDGILKLRPSKRNLNLHTANLRIVVQARTVDSLWLGGSGTIDADALRGDKLRFDIGGSGTINLKGIDADTAIVTIGGSGDLRSGAGSAKRVSISIGGSGDVDLGRVLAQDVNVTMGGSGTATVAASTSLSATIAGSGDVRYYGDPKLSKTVAGSGGLRRLGDAAR